MNPLNEFPAVMRHAREDLAGHLSGHFSPEAWTQILSEARRRLDARLVAGETPEAAWPHVVREFIGEKFWGHRAEVRAPKGMKQETRGLGVGFIWMTFSTFVLSIMMVVWLGQIFTASDDPKDAYRFYAAIVLVIANFAFFLWKTRKYKD